MAVSTTEYEEIKAKCVDGGLFDLETYATAVPSGGVCAVLGVISSWLQKSLDAHEQAIACLHNSTRNTEE